MRIKSAPIGLLQVQQDVFSDSYLDGRIYDVVLSAISWESRCIALLKKMSITNDKLTLLKFESQGRTAALKEKNLKKAEEILDGKSEILDLPASTDFVAINRDIEALITRFFEKLGRPLSVLIDISCIPKRYILFLLGMGFRREMIARMDLLYSEGKYLEGTPSLDEKGVPRGLVSEGQWLSVQVPYMEGNDYTPSQRSLFISLGAEISLAMPIIERIEPNRLNLYRVAGSNSRIPKSHIDSEATAFKDLCGFPNASVIEFELGDVIGLANGVLHTTTGNTTCLTIGTKTHAIAFGLAALADDRIQVVCRNPGTYSANDVEATGSAYVYSIIDRFEPSSYFKG